MSYSPALRTTALVALLAGIPGASVVFVQQAAPSRGAAQKVGNAWQPPRTAWGHPDLQGLWTSSEMFGVPVERHEELGERKFFNDEEVAKRQADAAKRQADLEKPLDLTVERLGGGTGAGPSHWYEWHSRPSRRTSLVIDPPDGRFPALTPAGEKMRIVLGSFGDTFNGPEDFNTSDRCITRGLPSAMFPTAYENGFRIGQTPNEVVIFHEYFHVVRVIPVDGRPHLGADIRLWEGDSRGRWEGNTLVVDVTNFTDKIKGALPPNGLNSADTTAGRPFRGTGASMRLIERWTRTSEDLLNYEATVEDPTIYTRPWTISLDLRLNNNYRSFEYACHEGNYAIPNTLSGARAQERQAGGGR
jgi:hypothetical protein